MNLDEWKDVLVECARNQDNMVGLPASNAQMGVVCNLFRQFWEEADGELVFAADDKWFRHETMKLLWDHPSLNDVDMATASTMIDELGRKNPVNERWELIDRGRKLLYLVMDELEEKHPTQMVMEGM